MDKFSHDESFFLKIFFLEELNLNSLFLVFIVLISKSVNSFINVK